MPPTLHQLEVFAAVARSGSFAGAAEQLYLSASAVTIQVQRLERQYGTPLLHRTSRGAVLTEAGRILLTSADFIKASLLDAANAIENTKPAGRSTLNVGGTEMVGIYVLPVAVSMFRRRMPRVDVNLIEASTERIEHALLTEAVDVAILSGEITSSDLEAEPCGSRPVKLLVHPDNPVAATNPVPCEMLKSQTLLLRRERRSSTRQVAEDAIKEHGLEFAGVVELEGVEGITAAALENRGVGFVQPDTVQAELTQGKLVTLSIQDVPLSIGYRAVHRAGRLLSPAAHEFLQCCRELLTLDPRQGLR